MQYDDALFRSTFPEFASDTTYPEAFLETMWDISSSFVSADGSPCSSISAKQLPYVLNLLAAHLIILAKQQSDAVLAGGASNSAQTGFETAASVGDISVSRLAPPVENGWQFWLAQSPYGAQLWALLSLLSVGGLSVGGLPEREGFRKVGGVFF